MKRSLVISGGGSKGAFAGGLIQKLYECGYTWDKFYGSSTGALLNTLTPIYDFESLKNIYTNVNNKDIFNKPPFSQKGKIKYSRSLWRTITGKKSIGEAKNLHELIKNTYTVNTHHDILSKGKTICICVTDYTNGKIEYAYNHNHDYDNFVLFTLASASVPVAMDLVKIHGNEYLDGAVMEHVPLQRAIDDGADEIDVVILRPNYSEVEMFWKSKNIFNVILRSVQLMMKEISESDVIIGKLKNKLGKNVVVNLFYVPQDLEGNSLIFDPVVMKGWWEAGYNSDIPTYSETVTKSSGLKINNYKLKGDI